MKELELECKASLDNLTSWFSSQCNGDWEHSYGIVIESLDNPGWSLSVELRGTSLESKTLERSVIERSSDDWISVAVSESERGPVFIAAGGTGNLPELLVAFRRFCLS